MPLYSYRCRKCSHKFELLLPINTDHEKVECPKCKAQNPERVISAFSSKSSCSYTRSYG